MFSKNVIKSDKGLVYYIAKEVGVEEHLRTCYINNEEGVEFIAKMVNLSKVNISKESIDQYLNARSVSANVDHPNMLNVVDKILTPKDLIVVTSFHDDESLEDIFVNRKNSFNEEYTRRFLTSFIECYKKILEKQGEQPLIKNNFSLANMFFKGGEILIGGWESGDLGKYFETYTLSHLNYKSPEYLSGEVNINLEAHDMWALGICLYGFLFSELPFFGTFANEILLNIEESSGQSLPFNEKVQVSFKLKTILSRLLEKDPSKRMTFTELAQNEYFSKDKTKNVPLVDLDHKIQNHFTKKQNSEKYKKVGGLLKKFANSLQNFEINRLSYENYNELNVKKPLATNIAFDMNITSSLMLNSSSVLDFSLSNPQIEIHEDHSGYNLFRENNIAEGLLPYLFEKNLIIFLMDTTKKVKDCEHLPQLSEIYSELLYAQILSLRKAWIQNYYMMQVMKHQVNIFNFDDFDKVKNNESYKLLEQFFSELNTSIKHLYHKLKEDCIAEFPSLTSLLSTVDEFDIEKVHHEFEKVIRKIQDVFRKKKIDLTEAERSLFGQAIIYLIYNKNSGTRFSFENFAVTQEWIHFCQFLNRKHYAEVEKQFI
jgi:serine/threonine protein kinase